jgi:microcystin-dependent protein
MQCGFLPTQGSRRKALPENVTLQPATVTEQPATAAAGIVIPIGTIMPFAGAVDVPWLRQQGWLYCDGASVQKTDYLDLFFAIGTNFGGGRTSFNLPDLRGRFCRGVDNGTGRDPYVREREPSAPGGLSGDQPGSVFGHRTGWTDDRPMTASRHEGHVHPVPHAPKTKNAYAIAGGRYSIWRSDPTESTESGKHPHTLASGGDQESRPLNKAVFFIIKFADAKAADPVESGAKEGGR